MKPAPAFRAGAILFTATLPALEVSARDIGIGSLAPHSKPGDTGIPGTVAPARGALTQAAPPPFGRGETETVSTVG